MDYLENILQHIFRPRFCLERQMYFNSKITPTYAYPMVCFCDIPLSNISEHSRFYGEYGIGMKREWAMRNNITPVHYQTQDYFLNKDAGRFYSSEDFFMTIRRRDFPKAEKYLNKLYHSMLVKPYKGLATPIDSNIPEEKIFYNEREWRYIVSREELDEWYLSSDKGKDEPLYILEDEYNRRYPNNLFAPSGIERIHFRPEDINYIIVDKDSEILDIIHFMLHTKEGFSKDDKLRLTSCIISMERIKNDF